MFFYFSPFYSTVTCLQKLVSAKLQKKSGDSWRLLPPSSSLVPQIILSQHHSLTPLLAAHQILISQVTFVSRAGTCLSVDIPPSIFPTDGPSHPICLWLTSCVAAFPRHESCPSVRPHPLSPAHSFQSNLSPNTKWHGPQMDWGLNGAH